MNRKRSKVYVLSMLAVIALIGLHSGIAQGQSVYSAVCDVIPSLPYYERGDFSESDNCDNPFDAVSGSYSASELNAEQFSPPGDDGQGGYIDITDDGHISLEWRVEVEFRSADIQQSYFDDRSDGKCRGFSKDPNFITESPAGATSCVGSEGYAIPYQYGPAAAAGFSRGFAVTPCVEVEVEITIHAGQPAPWERRRDSMEKTIDFATQALTALVNAADSACNQSSTTPPSNPPSNNPPPSSNNQPTIQIETPQGSEPVNPGEEKEVVIPSGGQVSLSADCAAGVVGLVYLLSGNDYDTRMTISESTRVKLRVIGAALADEICRVASQSATVTASQLSENISVELVEGSVDVEVESNKVNLQVSAKGTTANSYGTSEFSVATDNNSQETLVASKESTVLVQSSTGQSITLNSGQEVRANQTGVGQPAPIGSATPPGSNQPPSNNPPTRSVSNSGGLAQFDTDDDCMLSDSEFFSVTDSWIFEEIGNDLFFAAVDAWISQSSICTAAAGIRQLSLESVSLEQSGMGTLFFKATGQNISSMGVEVFDLLGNRVFSETQSGTSLRWNQRSTEGHRVANGVYLYRVSVSDGYGNSVYSEVRKLLVIN